MRTRKLEPSEWAEYFDYTAKHLPAMRIKISITGEDIGAQVETEDATLLGISYDRGDHALEIATEQLTHRISRPQEIYVQEKQGQLVTIEAIGDDGRKQIIQLVPLAALPES